MNDPFDVPVDRDGPTTRRYRRHDPATEAQAEAARPYRSVWVSANAGSGKTRVLTNRVARLLLAGAAPSRILCLTYTKAAAAEMQIRLFRTLGGWAMADDATLDRAIEGLLAEDEPPLSPADRETARRLFASALETPGGLKIQTIHAFCESLLSRFPLEAGVSPHFQVIDEMASATLLSEAQDRAVALAMAEEGGDPALRAALDHLLVELAETRFEEMLAEIVGNRGAYQAAGDDFEPALAAAIGATLGARRADLLAAWAERLDRGLVSRLAKAHGESSTKTDQTRASNLAAAAAAQAPEMALAALSSALLTKDGAPPSRGFPSKHIEESHPWSFEPIARLQREVMDLSAQLAAADRLANSTALARYARAVLLEYDRGKTDCAGVDFLDLIQKAVALLTRSDARDWIRFKLDGGIEHILVDEAQDTSHLQWRAVEALAEEFFSGDGAFEARGEEPSKPRRARTVFAVGDEKQSIYSFQGARPELLAAMGARFAERAGSAAFVRAGLATSFRSTPTILSFVDRVFAEPDARKGLAAEGQTVSHRAHRRDQAGLVEVWPLISAAPEAETPAWDQPVDAPPPDDPRRRLAELVAEEIARWIGREPLPARGRPIRAGDVLILVRSRGSLSINLIKRLKQLGVPVAGADRLALGDQIAVKDLTALAKVCLFPEDDLTLATVLRSPFCDLDEAALFELAHHRRPGQPLWYALSNRRDDRPDFAHAHALIAELVKQADYLRPYELFSLALGPKGGRPRLLARLGAEAEDPLDEFMAQTLAFETSGAPTLQAFVGWLARRDTDIKREHEQGRDEVRVMTAHGAKGLEAPVVILPDTVGAPSGGKSPTLLTPTLLTSTASDAPPIWVGAAKTDPPAVAALREAHQAREAEEHRRLLYVALTRAEDRLLICGALPRNTRKETAPEGSWYALCHAAAADIGSAAPSPVEDGAGRARPGLRIDGSGDAQLREPAAEDDVVAAPPAPWLRIKPPRETAPTDLSPSRLGGDDPEREGRTAVSSLDPETARKRGIAVHLLLEHLPGVAAEDRPALAERLLSRTAPEASEGLRADIIAEVDRVLAAEELAEVFGPGSRAEVPIGAVIDQLGPGELHGLIDRLVASPERVLIVDYKTGPIPPTPPEGYLRQLAAYRAALSQIFPGRRVEAALLWTAGPRLERLAETELDAAFARAAADLDRDRRDT